MTIFLIAVLILTICFGVVIIFGAPYLPTLSEQVEIALDLADLKPGQILLELGCGDGKVLIAAARRGVKSVGYELNPIMAFIAWLRTLRYRKLVKVKYGNLWTSDWPAAQAIFVFILPKFMARLDNKIETWSCRPVKLVSFAFSIPNKKPKSKNKGVFLYEYR